MIKANKKIGIVYCCNSEKYVEELEQIIRSKKSEGYCIETLVVDNKLIDSERMIDKRVFNNLDKCDYGIVFLTKDLETQDNKFVSRPNVLVELGYLRGHLGKNCIWCITDFPHRDIEEKRYILPSDYVAEVVEEIEIDNYEYGLKKIVEKFIKTHKITKLDNYNANDLVSSLILNPHYKTDFESLFSKDKLKQINKYSMQCQQEEILEMWLEEKNRLSEEGQIVYLFERMVFLPFFPEKIISSKLMEYLSVKNNEENKYIFACRKILKIVNGYAENKRNKSAYIGTSFYLKTASQIEHELNVFNNVKVAPIIECVARNYIGLCYLNAYLSLPKEQSHEKDSKERSDNLKKARNNFDKVLQLSEENFSDKVEVFQAFANYNKARVLRNLQVDADLEYYTAINQRKFLSEASDFPEIFKLNFVFERIYAEIDYYGYAKEKGMLNVRDYNEKIENLSEELKDIRQTPAADVSLFKTLEDKLNKCKNELS